MKITQELQARLVSVYGQRFVTKLLRLMAIWEVMGWSRCYILGKGKVEYMVSWSEADLSITAVS